MANSNGDGTYVPIVGNGTNPDFPLSHPFSTHTKNIAPQRIRAVANQLAHMSRGWAQPIKIHLFEGAAQGPPDPEVISPCEGLDNECVDALWAVSDVAVEAVDYTYECVQDGFMPNGEEWERIEQASRLVIDEHRTQRLSSQMDCIAEVASRPR